MNPFSEPITFESKKENHFYAIKENGEYLKVENPKKGDKVYEIPTVSGGSDKKPLILEIPIPLCDKHQHGGKPFGVKTCRNWEYIAIPVPLGSLTCRECRNELFLPQPYLSRADLSGADLSGADLSGADLSGADLSDADLSDADLRHADLSDADLSGADLRHADLSGADLSGADLRHADLSGADLRHADLRHADLSGADLSGADLSGALHLSLAYWNKFTQIDSRFRELLEEKRCVE